MKRYFHVWRVTVAPQSIEKTREKTPETKKDPVHIQRSGRGGRGLYPLLFMAVVV